MALNAMAYPYEGRSGTILAMVLCRGVPGKNRRHRRARAGGVTGVLAGHAPESPRRPEPRPGRSRARLSRLLPALALLLGALSLLPAASAQAQTTTISLSAEQTTINEGEQVVLKATLSPPPSVEEARGARVPGGNPADSAQHHGGAG